jgi:type I restriction enzyme R subunit
LVKERRKKVDQLLKEAGWVIHDYREINLGASLGIPVREFPLKTGFADYLLFIDRKLAYFIINYFKLI